MEAGAEDSLDSLGPEVAGVDDKLKSERRKLQIIRKKIITQI